MADHVDVSELQRSLNHFTNKYVKHVRPLRVDGEKGPATNSRIRFAKAMLGYEGDPDARVTSKFVRRLRHPKDPEYSSKRQVRRGERRRAAERARWKRSKALSYVVPGVTRFEGRPVARCAVPYLQYARSHGWHDSLNSGWRDPFYSRSLCRAMCGADTCRGRCAGTSSNHVGNSCSRFAIDVSGYVEFARLMRTMPNPPNGHRIYNALGSADPVHFSPSGR